MTALPALAAGASPAPELFGSLVLRGELDVASQGLSPALGPFTDFLSAYGQWFRHEIASTGRLHLVYGRSLTVAMPEMIHAPALLETLAVSARAAGMALELMISARDGLQAVDRVTAALGVVDAVFLVIEPDLPDACDPALRDLVERCLAARPGVYLDASPGRLRALGVLRAPAYNARHVTVFAAPVRPGHIVRVPDVPSAPCRTRLRLHVDAAGDVYPCAGLLGVPAARMGSVLCTPPHELFAGPMASSWPAWARTGPDLPPISPPYDLCAVHRDRLLGAGAQS